MSAVRAAVCRSYGPPEIVRVEDSPVPAIADGQVKVRVVAAAPGVQIAQTIGRTVVLYRAFPDGPEIELPR